MRGNPHIDAMVPVSDVGRAVEFYGGQLGLELFERGEEMPYARFRSGDTRLNVYQSGTAGQAKHTLASFAVEDVRATVADLRQRGVEFQEYDSGPFKTEEGVATTGDTHVAWIEDPDGNILEIVGG